MNLKAPAPEPNPTVTEPNRDRTAPRIKQAATSAVTLTPGYATLPTIPNVSGGGFLTTTSGHGWTAEIWWAPALGFSMND